MKILSKDLVQALFYSVPLTHSRTLSTQASIGDYWTLTGTSKSVSCGGHCSFPRVLVHTVLLVPTKSLFTQVCISLVIKSHWPPKSISLGVSVLLPDARVGKYVVGPRTFLIMQGFNWYNCCAVCASFIKTIPKRKKCKKG